MFGMNAVVTHNGVTVRLRPFSKEDLPVLVANFSSMCIHLFTKGLFAQTYENELEWYEKNRKSPDEVTWAIVPGGQDEAIGVTSLHQINSRSNTCGSGIIIWDQKWWGKGIASAAHLVRTLFAADYLNRFTIRSTVRVPNVASRRALERVGYTVWGTEPLTIPRDGGWIDTHGLIWLHPDRIGIFYPEGLPAMYSAGVEKAKLALATARREVIFP